MKKIFYGMLCIYLLVFASVSLAQDKTILSPKDLKPLIGSWKGNLIYMDYSSNKPYSMPADLIVKQLSDPQQFQLSNIYPDEPKANGFDTLIITQDGKLLNGEIIKSIKNTSDGSTVIVTEKKGIDGNDDKPAVIKHTFTFNSKVFIIRKDVMFDGSNQWLNRHEYTYTRK